ncbi:MAG: hypothetical protein CMG00_03120 [Candidatus Marinimicrobia bacterium]|nr:hypothetical protein [Candidatus Neomarinimicrobiota bacterium]
MIPSNPDKGRISEFVLSQSQINLIKKNAKNYNPSPLSYDETVVIETNKGTIKIKLFNDISPKHCYNFKKLCNSGFYDRTSFHRVIKDYIIQGGDLLSRDSDRSNDGKGGPGWTIDEEFNNISHKRGIVSMARSNDFDSAGAQFFICVKDSPWLDGKYTVFGEVIEGLEIVDKISLSPTDRSMTLNIVHNKIPEQESVDKWIEVMDYVSRKKVFLKIPRGETKSSYYDKVKKDLNSYNPYRRTEIIKARVYNDENFK